MVAWQFTLLRFFMCSKCTVNANIIKYIWYCFSAATFAWTFLLLQDSNQKILMNHQNESWDFGVGGIESSGFINPYFVNGVMVCKGICHRYKAIIPQRVSRYTNGNKRCNECEIYLKWDGLRCPCCQHLLRNSPKNAKYRINIFKRI